jgi:hypothetical protein
LAGEGYRGLASSDAKERDEGEAEAAEAVRGFVGKQGDPNDRVCQPVKVFCQRCMMTIQDRTQMLFQVPLGQRIVQDPDDGAVWNWLHAETLLVARALLQHNCQPQHKEEFQTEGTLMDFRAPLGMTAVPKRACI